MATIFRHGYGIYRYSPQPTEGFGFEMKTVSCFKNTTNFRTFNTFRTENTLSPLLRLRFEDSNFAASGSNTAADCTISDRSCRRKMSAGLTYTMGRTTAESSLSDRLKRFKPRVLADEDMCTKIMNPAQETLVSKCMKVVILNFERMPVKVGLSELQMAEISSQLQTTLSPLVGAKYVFNETYWKKCCVEKYGWHGCNLLNHGMLWKRLYFEKLLTERLEDFDFKIDNEVSLYTLVEACSELIFTVTFRQLRSHIDLLYLLLMLPNLTKLDLTYSVGKIGMNYERKLFGIKMHDATALGKAFAQINSLTTISLTGNMLDDILLGVLMSGLMDNNTVTSLDLSHNKIGDHGASLLSKFLLCSSALTSLNVADNRIGIEGGRHFAEVLKEKNFLLHLNIKLNCLSDDGCHMLLEGLLKNSSIREVDIGSNMAGNMAAKTLCSLIQSSEGQLQSLNVACNDFTADHFENFLSSLANNRSLIRFDIRGNLGYRKGSRIVEDIESIIHTNDFKTKRRGEYK